MEELESDLEEAVDPILWWLPLAPSVYLSYYPKLLSERLLYLLLLFEEALNRGVYLGPGLLEVGILKSCYKKPRYKRYKQQFSGPDRICMGKQETRVIGNILA